VVWMGMTKGDRSVVGRALVWRGGAKFLGPRPAKFVLLLPRPPRPLLRPLPPRRPPWFLRGSELMVVCLVYLR
jgi:hypothetical protein